MSEHGRPVLSTLAERRVQAGLAVQPFVAAAVAFGLFPVLEAATPGTTVGGVLGPAIAIAVFVGITAAIITGCVAYPAFRWLLKRGRVTAATTIVSGMVLGNIPLAVAFIALAGGGGGEGGPPRGSMELNFEFASLVRLLFGTIIGGVSAAVFWWIAGASLPRQPRHTAAGAVVPGEDTQLR